MATGRQNGKQYSALHGLLNGASIIAGLLAWAALSHVYPPLFLPSPSLTLIALLKLIDTGELLRNAAASLFRILSGWALGCIVGAALGIALGWFETARKMFRGVVEYLRFVPPVTLVTLFIIWLGVGELSKVVLIAWVSIFVVIVNTMAGVASVRAGAIQAARSLGANNIQVLVHVVIPEAIPFLVVGFQLALSNAFMTIVAAEMLAAHSGLGFMIWDAQVYAQTDHVFVAFATLCVLGFCLDRLVRVLSRRLLTHYKIV